MFTSPRIGIGVVIINTNDEILLVKRSNPPNKGQWSIPGGHLEFGEQLKEAAIREIHEETNLTIYELELLDAVDFFHKDIKGEVVNHYVLIDFKTYSFSGIPKAGSDADAIKWVNKDNIKDFIVWDETIRIINKAFEG